MGVFLPGPGGGRIKNNMCNACGWWRSSFESSPCLPQTEKWGNLTREEGKVVVEVCGSGVERREKRKVGGKRQKRRYRS